MAFPRSLFSRCISPLFRSNKVTSCGAYLPSSASYSTHFVDDDPILVRDFIHAALYDPKDGYFSQRSSSVGVLEQSIKFSQLEGRSAYLHLLDKIYKQSEVSWFTPVELFKPWYAHGIAQAILRTANLSVPLKIYEIGGGSGTCAKGIMDYLKLNAPTRVYDDMSYISVEISPSLAEKQIATVGEVQSHLSKFRVECRDAADLGGWGEAEQQPCWVIMLEVLDNLPHDLIYSVNQFSPWMEVWVEKHRERSELSELYKPVQDRLITSCIEILDLEKATQGNLTSSMAKKMWAKVFPKPQRCWLPTGCLRDGNSVDYNNYLDAKGDADIFFPTDFWLLERMDHYCSGWLKPHEDKSSKKGKKRRTIVLDTSAFMEEFGFPTKTRTRSGYNPLLDDFKNTKVYLSVPTHNTK